MTSIITGVFNQINQAGELASTLNRTAEQVVERAQMVDRSIDQISTQIGSKVQTINNLYLKAADGYRFFMSYAKNSFPISILRGGALAGSHKIIFSSLQFLSPLKFTAALLLPLWVAMEFSKLTNKYLEYSSFKKEIEERIKQMGLTLEQIEESVGFKLPIYSEQIDLLKIFLDDNLRKDFSDKFPNGPISIQVQSIEEHPVVNETSSQKKQPIVKPKAAQEKSDTQESTSVSKVNEESEQPDWNEEFTNSLKQGDIKTLEQAWAEIQGNQVATSFTKELSESFEKAWAQKSSEETLKQVFEQVWAQQADQATFGTVWEELQKDTQTKELISEFEKVWNSSDILKIKELKDKIENNETTTFSKALVCKAIKARFNIAAERVNKDIQMIKILFSTQPLEKGRAFLKKILSHQPSGFTPYEIFDRGNEIQQMINGTSSSRSKI